MTVKTFGARNAAAMIDAVVNYNGGGTGSCQLTTGNLVSRLTFGRLTPSAIIIAICVVVEVVVDVVVVDVVVVEVVDGGEVVSGGSSPLPKFSKSQKFMNDTSGIG